MMETEYVRSLRVDWKAEPPVGSPTVVSTFAGCGGSSLGYRMAGFRELLAVDFEENAVATFARNFPGVPVWQRDITKVTAEEVLSFCKIGKGDLDVFDGSPPCFPAGTDVWTARGKVPIEGVEIGDLVLTHRGRYRRVVGRTKRIAGGLRRLVIKYGREDIVCTEGHPLYVRRRAGPRVRSYSAPEWAAAKEIRPGDVVLEPHVAEVPDLVVPDVVTRQRINVEGQSGSDRSEMRLLSRPCSLDWKSSEFAWVLGFYVAEGHRRGREPTFVDGGPYRREVVFSVADKEAAPLSVRLSGMGLHACVQRHSQGSSRVSVSDLDLWSLVGVVGEGAGGKRIPAAFHAQPEEWQKAFLDGYFEGDGCLKRNGKAGVVRKATTVSRDLAEGVARMVARAFGVVASIDVLYPAGVGSIQGRSVMVREAYSVGYSLPGSRKPRPGFVDEAGAWLPVVSNEEEDRAAEDVYNLEVEEDESYVAGGLAVHNCQGFSMSGSRKVSDPRNSLFMEFVRLIEGLGPRVFLMENVAGQVRGKMRGAFIEIMRVLKGTGYAVKCALLNAAHYGVPQHRERMIYIGVRPDVGAEPSFPRPSARVVTCGEAIGDLEGFDDGVKMPGFSKSPRASRMLSQIREGQHGLDADAKGGYFNTARIDRLRVAPTILKTSSPASGLVHYDGSRWLTIAEAKRIASFPDDFELIGSYQHRWARIGNAVMPMFMRALASHVRKEILGR